MQESLCPCAFVRACVCVCGCVYIFSPFKCKQTGCKTFCFSLNYHLKKKSNVSTYTEYSCTQSETTTHTHTRGARSRPCTASISVKLRIKLPVNLARFPCQKQPLCECFSFAGFTRLFLSRPAVSP